MSRNYGSLGRRSGSTAWQWIIIGAILGFGCSVVLVLGALAFGVLNVDGMNVANLPTQTPFIITATPAPVTPTNTAEATPQTEEVLLVEPPTATPTLDPTLLTPEPTITPTTPPMNGFGTTPETSGAASTDVVRNTSGSVAGGDARFADVAARASGLVSIDGGTFEMGTSAAEIARAVQECVQGYGGDPGACTVAMGEDSLPAHQVTVSPFMIEETEVSYDQFLTFLNTMGPGSHRNGCFGQPCAQTTSDSETSNIQFLDSVNYTVNIAITNYPVTNVTWYGAQAYCQAIGRRLPTEAEWERAARGPSNTIYPWGNDWNGANAATRRNENGQQTEAQPVNAYTQGAVIWPAGSVLNMAGNVAEWVYDWYDVNYYDSPSAAGPDPQGPANGSAKVNRGGSWDTMPFFARNVHRREQNPTLPTADIGFRCVADSTGSTGSDAPLGSEPLPVTTVDPAALGVNSGGANEESINNSQPTLRPSSTPQPVVAPTTEPLGTLDPNG